MLGHYWTHTHKLYYITVPEILACMSPLAILTLQPFTYTVVGTGYNITIQVEYCQDDRQQFKEQLQFQVQEQIRSLVENYQPDLQHQEQQVMKL